MMVKVERSYRKNFFVEAPNSLLSLERLTGQAVFPRGGSLF